MWQNTTSTNQVGEWLNQNSMIKVMPIMPNSVTYTSSIKWPQHSQPFITINVGGKLVVVYDNLEEIINPLYVIFLQLIAQPKYSNTVQLYLLPSVVVKIKMYFLKMDITKGLYAKWKNEINGNSQTG